ncbi:MAG: hypothetical protein QW568_03800 [Candidatus Anstonellaceae archaeon]
MKSIARERKPSISPLVRTHVDSLLSLRDMDAKKLESPAFQREMFEAMASTIVARADELRRSFSIRYPKIPLALCESADLDGSQSISLITRAGAKELELVRVSFRIGRVESNCEYEPGPLFQVSYCEMYYSTSQAAHYTRADSVFGVFERIIGKEGWLRHEKAPQAVLLHLEPKED